MNLINRMLKIPLSIFITEVMGITEEVQRQFKKFKVTQLVYRPLPLMVFAVNQQLVVLRDK